MSVKTRIGYNKNEIQTWIPELLSENIAALIVHLRTRKEMSDVPAHWDLMNSVVKIRDEMGKDTLILGNGDVVDTDDGRRKCKDFGCDGVMLGRAIFGNPWLFANNQPMNADQEPINTDESIRVHQNKISVDQRIKVLIEHTKLFEKLLGNYKNFAIMKKHYKAYVNGFDGAKELRMKLMEAETADQIAQITDDFLAKIE